MDEDQEREVALGLREGRPDAWRALYEAFAGRVWGTVARRVDAADVADVVQETFLAAARSARSFDPARGPLWGWLCGIARLHVALHYRKAERRDRARLAHARPAAADGTADALERVELATLVRATLTGLPPDYETLLTAKYLDGESVEAIACRERSTETAVRSKLARARQAFRAAFAPHAPAADRPVRTNP